MHTQPYYKQFGWKEGDFYNAEMYYKRCLSLQIYPTLTDIEQDYVIKSIIDFFNNDFETSLI